MIFVNGRNFTKKELQQRLDKMNIAYENDLPQKEYYIQLYNNAMKDESKRKYIINDNDNSANGNNNNKHFKFKRERTLTVKERDDAIVKTESIEIIKQQQQQSTKTNKDVCYKTLMLAASALLINNRDDIKNITMRKEKIMAYMKVSCVGVWNKLKTVINVVGKIIEESLHGKEEMMVWCVVVGVVVVFCGVMMYKLMRRRYYK